VKNKKKIVLFTAPRHGSNYLLVLISRFKNISAEYEIFSPGVDNLKRIMERSDRREIYIPKTLADSIQRRIDMRGSDGKDIINYVESFGIRKFLNLLTTNISQDNFIFKLFANHLDDQKRKDIMHWSDGIIFLKRRPIDGYISFAKALEVKNWCGTNTSKIKIKFCPKQYNWYKKTFVDPLTYYEEYARLSLMPFFCVQYEGFHEISIDQQIKSISNRMKHYFGANLEEFPQSLKECLLRKQDKSTCYKDKIKNYNEFERYCKKNNIDISE